MSNDETVFDSNVRIENDGSIKLNSKKDLVTLVPIDTYNVISEVVYNIIHANGYYIICGANGIIAYTNDITNSSSWNKYTVGDRPWESMIYANGYYIICGYSGFIAYTNDITNSNSWNKYFVENNYAWLSIIYANGYYITVGNEGLIAYTNDITNSSSWNIYTVGDRSWISIIYANGYYIICGSNGYIAYTNDITNSSSWNKYTVGDRSWESIIYANGYYILCGNNGSIAYTNDITNSSSWNKYIVVQNGAYWYSMIYANGYYIICGSDGSIAGSKNITDPDSWYVRSIGTRDLRAMTYANNNIVIASYPGSITYGNIKDGITQPTISSASNGNLYISNTPMIEMLANIQTENTQLRIIAPSRKNASTRIMIGTADASFRSADFGFVDSDTDPYTTTKVVNADSELRVYKNRVQVIGNIQCDTINGMPFNADSILTTTTPYIPVVKNDAVMEIGRIIDFHTYVADGEISGEDHDCRLWWNSGGRGKLNCDKTFTAPNISSSFTVTHETGANEELIVGTYCETDGTIYEQFKDNIKPDDCICNIKQATSLNNNIVGITVSTDPIKFATHGDVLIKVIPNDTYNIGDIIVPGENGYGKKGSDEEIMQCVLHRIPTAKIISLETDIPNQVACLLL